MSVIRRFAIKLLPLAGAVALVASNVSSAQAGTYFRVYQGSDYAGIDLATGWVEVCDMEQDGNGVYGVFSGPGASQSVPDPNGSAAGCGNTVIHFSVDEIAACEKDFLGPHCGIARIG